MALGDQGRPEALPALHEAYRTCEPWQRIEFEDVLRDLHRGRRRTPLWTRDWRLRYRRQPTLGSFLPSWVWMAMLMQRQTERRAERVVIPLRPLEEIVKDPPEPGESPETCEQCGAPVERPMAETSLQHGLDPGPASERYQVIVHVDAAVLADPDQPGQSTLEDGVHVSAETSRRLACDATRVVMRHAGDGQVLDVGRRTRTIPPALRCALQARDRGCRFPGCGVRHAQGHHIHHWANGGPTRLDHLALLCRRHHRAVHEEGYEVTRDADGTLCFNTPTGRPIPDVPPPPAVPLDPTQALVAAHQARGVAIDARTGCPSWLGERLDLVWAIGVLHPAAQPAVPGPAGRSP
jgi:hypothetical protein